MLQGDLRNKDDLEKLFSRTKYVNLIQFVPQFVYMIFKFKIDFELFNFCNFSNVNTVF